MEHNKTVRNIEAWVWVQIKDYDDSFRNYKAEVIIVIPDFDFLY